VTRVTLGLVAAVLVLLSAGLPVWEARLDVKQYPEGPLVLTAFGDRLQGDVEEVRILNHYVGLKVFDMADLWETALWIPAVVAALGLVVVAVLFPRRSPGAPKPPRSSIGTLARVGLWAIPVGILADVQFRLYQLGHSMDSGAAFRQEPFTPWVVGRVRVASNTVTTAWPGRAVALLLAAAFLMTFGMSLYRFAKLLLGIGPRPAAASLVALVLGASIAAPSLAATPEGWLQATIDAAAPGATIVLRAGTYAGPVVVDRPLHLRGEPGAVIDGTGVGSVVTITAPGVELEGLTIVHGGRDPVGASSGVLVERNANGASLHDLVIRDCHIGITVQRAADVVIERVDIRGAGIISGELHVSGTEDEEAVTLRLRGDGIWLYDAPRPVVRDSVIRTVRDGIYLSYGSGAVLDGNMIEDSRYAIHDMYAADLVVRDQHIRANLSGLVLMYGGPVEVASNTITESGSPSTGFGVLVKDAGGVTIRGNVIADNRVGLLIDDAGRTGVAATTVEGNTVALNQTGVVLVPSADPTFTRNAFVENSTQVALGGGGRTQAVWTRDGVGNHWSDYDGFDADGDGIGDLAYRRSGRASRLIADQPLLQALASGPGWRLLASVEDRWASGEPLVVDDAPLVDPAAPPIGEDGRRTRLPLAVPGLALALTCVWLLRRGRLKGVPARA